MASTSRRRSCWRRCSFAAVSPLENFTRAMWLSICTATNCLSTRSTATFCDSSQGLSCTARSSNNPDVGPPGPSLYAVSGNHSYSYCLRFCDTFKRYASNKGVCPPRCPPSRSTRFSATEASTGNHRGISSGGVGIRVQLSPISRECQQSKNVPLSSLLYPPAKNSSFMFVVPKANPAPIRGPKGASAHIRVHDFPRSSDAHTSASCAEGLRPPTTYMMFTKWWCSADQPATAENSTRPHHFVRMT
mmetsp:Transcript_110931/g.192344  ORF Transcript_110931/g.192344 Transcript_110931/m.192344 type:complete len:246 (-) Transcript_110931:543-1280(-)